MDTELQRLFALGLTEEEHLTASKYYRAKWTAETRKAYHESHPENFAGPDMSYPIKDGSDVNDAARLAGKASNPGAVRSKIIAIAKRLGLTGSLPASWKEGQGDGQDGAHERGQGSINSDTGAQHGAGDGAASGSGPVDNDNEDTTVEDGGTDTDSDRAEAADDLANPKRAASPTNHAVMSGTHSHAHGHMDGYGHEHPHSHNNDNQHDHGHVHDTGNDARRALDADALPTPAPMTRAALEGFVPGQTIKMFAPIVRVDAARREVYGQATTEKPDSFGTIFAYNPDAWKRWRGNVREQHDPHKAVGRSVNIEYDAEDKSVFVGSRVSRGAQDTWLKVEDGTLSGYSVSILPKEPYGLDPRKWPKRSYGGRDYPFCPDYDIVELSLVDSPATPGCNIEIVRANGFANDDVLDYSEEGGDTTAQQIQSSLHTLATIGGDSASSSAGGSPMHAIRDTTERMFVTALRSCPCADCQRSVSVLAPGDSPTLSLDSSHQLSAERVLVEVAERVLAPIYQRQQAVLSRFVRAGNENADLARSLTALGERLTTIEQTVTRLSDELSHQQELHASMETVKGLVERIAAQPQTGGPVLSGAGVANAQSTTGRALAEIRRLQEMGVALSPIQQQALAQTLFQPL